MCGSYHPVGLFPFWYIIHPLVHQVVEILNRGRSAHQIEIEGEMGARVRIVAAISHCLLHRGVCFRRNDPEIRNSVSVQEFGMTQLC
jgi:hypothetical protein